MASNVYAWEKNRGCVYTGVPTVDALLGCVSRPLIIDFYGDPHLVKLLSYRLSAYWHCDGGVALGIVHDGPVAYDLYLIRSLLRVMGCSEEGFLVARAFRIEDSLEMLEEALDKGVGSLVIYNPYASSPPRPEEYWRLTPLNGAFRRIYNKGASIALFNSVSRFGVFLPEGGKMHHHQTHIIVRLDRGGSRSYKATIVKHYLGRRGSLIGSLKELLAVNRSWGEQFLLSEWL